MKPELIRTYFAEATNGILLLDGAAICPTIELPWKNNEPRISCIPEGIYRLLKRYSPHHIWHLELQDGPGRQLILIHAANDALHELQGYIAPVSGIQGVNYRLRLLPGRAAFMYYNKFALWYIKMKRANVFKLFYFHLDQALF